MEVRGRTSPPGGWASLGLSPSQGRGWRWGRRRRGDKGEREKGREKGREVCKDRVGGRCRLRRADGRRLKIVLGIMGWEKEWEWE